MVWGGIQALGCRDVLERLAGLISIGLQADLSVDFSSYQMSMQIMGPWPPRLPGDTADLTRPRVAYI